MEISKKGRRSPLWLLVVFSASSAILGAASCSKTEAGASAKPLVVATIFPDYDFVREIAGDRVDLKLLLPPGVEAHGFEPKPSDMGNLARAAMFVHTGRYMEPWAEKLATGSGNDKLLIVDASKGIELMASRDEDGHGEDQSFDPHIWLDPTLAAKMVATIAEGLATIDPKGASIYEERAAAYEKKLAELDAEIEAGLRGVKLRTIVYGGHFAFGYFARRYGLDYISPYKGFSPDSEPTPKAIAALADAIKATLARVVFYEELLEPNIARVLSEGSGAKIELLHGAHNVSRQDLESGIGYIAIMRANLAKLRDALGVP